MKINNLLTKPNPNFEGWVEDFIRYYLSCQFDKLIHSVDPKKSS